MSHIEEKYLLSTKTHEDWRNYLLVNSFFFEVLMRQLRKELHIPSEGLGSIHEIIDWERNHFEKYRMEFAPKSKGGKKAVTRQFEEQFELEDVVHRELYKPIFKAVETFHFLDISFGLLNTFVFGHTNISFPWSTKVQIITSPNNPIKETGVYIKYTPDITNRELALLKKQAKKGYETLSKIKDFKIEKRKKNTRSPNKVNLNIYLAVEQYLIQEKIARPYSFNIDPIFEVIAKKLKSTKGTIRRKYYTIVNNFHLPTIQELNRIPRD